MLTSARFQDEVAVNYEKVNRLNGSVQNRKAMKTCLCIECCSSESITSKQIRKANHKWKNHCKGISQNQFSYIFTKVNIELNERIKIVVHRDALLSYEYAIFRVFQLIDSETHPING